GREAMPLAWYASIRWGSAPLSQGHEDGLGLLGRDDLVLAALQDQQRCRDALDVVDRRTFAEQACAVGVRSDERLLVVRLELVLRLLDEQLEVRDSIGRD